VPFQASGRRHAHPGSVGAYRIGTDGGRLRNKIRTRTEDDQQPGPYAPRHSTLGQHSEGADIPMPIATREASTPVTGALKAHVFDRVAEGHSAHKSARFTRRNATTESRTDEPTGGKHG
jgi:hypothetical protein